MFNGIPYTIVGGTFDDQGGKPSGLMIKLAQKLERLIGPVALYNGGNWTDLAHGVMPRIQGKQIVIWAANVPNEYEKIVHEIKRYNPEAYLVTTKRNYGEGDRYTRQDLVARALASKSNLLLEFTKPTPDTFGITIIDPLGNVFGEPGQTDLNQVTLSLVSRMTQLIKFTRMGSRPLSDDPIPAPDVPEFYEMVRRKADQFHEVIHGANTERMLGNASFRCTFGFPSMCDRTNDVIFVTRRNIDKRLLNRDGFVAVRGLRYDRVEYYGPHKPSVDTPVQILLYNYFPHVNFMVHSHTHVPGAPFTDSLVPCGAIEEFLEIARLFPDPEQVTNQVINLKGHGSLILARDISFINDQAHVHLDSYRR